MKTPILIAAHNEEAYIAETLNGLPRCVEPIVIANGCTDKTTEIVAQTGAVLIEIDEASKIAALQEGMRYIGSTMLDGFVIVDADTRPMFKNSWATAMKQKLSERSNIVFCGPIIFGNERGNLTGSVRSARNLTKDVKSRKTSPRLYGANMAVRPTKDSIDEILELPSNLWPGEDRAIKTLIESNGGIYEFSVDPRLLVVTSARAHTDLKKRLIKGKQWGKDECLSWYASKAPKSSINFEDWLSLREV